MTSTAENWTRCEPREITNLARRLRARRRRRVGGAAALIGLSAAVLLAVWLYPRRDQGPDFAGIPCERVMELADAYAAGQLSPQLQDQISRHIALCPHCRPMFERMQKVSSHPRGRAGGNAMDKPKDLGLHVSMR